MNHDLHIFVILLFKKAQHAKFTKEQSGSGTARQEMFCKLAGAYDAFKELKNNLSEGAKFYNDLTQVKK